MSSTVEYIPRDTTTQNSLSAHIMVALPWLVLTLLLVLSLWLRWRYTWVQGFHYDEGHWLMFALLVNAGHPAYTETFVGIPPLALLTIQGGAALFGPTLSVRYPMMLFSLVGIGAIFWWFQPAKSAFGLIAGLLAGTLLSFAPLFFSESASIMAEVPAVSLSLLSLVLAQQYYFNQKLYWLFLSGLVFALSLALKIFVVFLPAVIGLLILLALTENKPDTDRSFIGHLLICGGSWLLGLSLPLIIIVLVYNPQAMYQQVVAFRFALRQATLAASPNNILLENIIRLTGHIIEYRLLFAGAILGAIVGWRKQQPDILVWSAWLVLGAVMLIWHIPLRDRYFAVLLPGLAALSGLGLACGLQWLGKLVTEKTKNRLWGTGGVALSVVAIIIFTASKAAILAFSPISTQSPDYLFDTFSLDRNKAISYIKENTFPGDCVVTDDQRVAIAAARPVPPALSETSFARLRTGWLLTVDDVIREIDANDCQIVVYATERFDRREQLSARLQEMYFLEINYTDQATIFAAKQQIAHPPGQTLDVQLGEAIILQGTDLSPSPWQPGQNVQMAAYWSALKPPDRAYKIFVQLRDNNNQTVAIYDHFPFSVSDSRYQLAVSGAEDAYLIVPHIKNLQIPAGDISLYPQKGMLPTNAWPEGQTIREVTSMKLPADLPPGSYTLYIGMYDPDTGVRLPAKTENGESDEILAAQIDIVESR